MEQGYNYANKKRNILLKDIVKRYNVRNVSLLEKISAFLFDNTGNLLIASNITKYLESQKIQTYSDTVQIYIDYFLSTFLTHKASRYDLKKVNGVSSRI